MSFTTYANGDFRLSRDNLRQLDPKVFERAALRVEGNRDSFTCHAIEHESRGLKNSGVYRQAWRAAFDHDMDDDKSHPFWNYGLYDNDKRGADTAKQARLTSLAMMATLVRAAKASRGVRKPKVSQ